MDQPRTTPATPRNPSYRLEHVGSKLCIRLHCAPAPAGDAPHIIAEPCLASHASRFTSWEAAAVVAARYLPRTPVEIVRVDA